ncbi:hypothetical protein SAMN05216464_110172 [Mucilaginibacter pineti]|uniref:Uncharacterized protein n=1 Tax=Mucilaginibacter pineti TaxID=1391627 RepID=A0A1G7GJC3_9SPHI|nr:hypothetical protein [Mucilaginibacter pineti]SDE88216.1 hypothetical protein SAMN05216464_110172 [Mucilaginibacter pineti]
MEENSPEKLDEETMQTKIPDKSQPASKDEMAGIEIDDDVYFFVDFVKLQVREHANPDNIIPFSKMKDTGTHYEFMYDPLTRTISSSASRQNYKVSFRNITKLHPDAVARIYKVPLEEVKKRNDKEFFRDLNQIRQGEKKEVKQQKKRGMRM